MEMIILSDGTVIDYVIESGKNCKIVNSFLVKSKRLKYEFIDYIIKKYPQFKARSRKSYYREWKAHNIFYKLHISKKHTKDTDLNIKEYWWRRVGYFFVSIFSVDF